MKQIHVNNFSKKINGNYVLKNVNLTVTEGKVYGFYGRNGSGKTMLFRAISGLIYADEGSISIGNLVLHKDMQIPENIGVLIENPGFFPYLSALDNLNLLANIRKKIGKKEIFDVLNLVGLDATSHKKFKAFSLGMKQKLGIAQAIMENPDILILDEPTNGLDEEGIETIRSIIKKNKEANKIILLASHNKEDLTILCDEIYKMENGEIKGRISL